MRQRYMSSLAVAPAQFKEVNPIPRPEGELPAGKLVDEHGDTLNHGRDSLMVRADNKMSRKREYSGWAIAALTTGPSIIAVIITAAVLIFGWVRSDESQIIKIAIMEKQNDEIRNDIKELNRKFDDIQKALNERAVEQAGQQGRVQGYTLGQTDAAGQPHPKK